MPRTAPFESHHRRYDEWFERHAAAYHSELLAVRAQLPWQGLGLSVGVGTGRFAAPLGVQVGIDPAHAVLGYAAKRVLPRCRRLPKRYRSRTVCSTASCV